MTAGTSYIPAHITGETYGPATSSNDLLAVASGVYVPLTGMQVVLPEPGTYRLTADVRAAIGGAPPINAHVVARLFNVTTATALPNSARIVAQANEQAPGVGDFSDQTTAPINEFLTVTVPTTIRIEAAHVITSGTPTVANANNSPANGRSRLAYERVAI